MAEKNRVLLIGYGNPGRLDDGLGPALAEEIEKKNIPGVTVDSNYQLTVEDASVVANHEVVIFADAALQGREPFFFKELKPKKAQGFSSHSIEPEIVLWMAHSLFHSQTKGFALGIRGYEFNEFGLKLSEKAKTNLEAAVKFIEYILSENDFSELE